MGACLFVSKLVSVTCLGILTGYLTNQSHNTIPKLVQTSRSDPLNHVKAAIASLINNTRLWFVGLGSVATTLFSMSFFKAPPRARHPYLLYASLGTPIAAGYLLIKNYPIEFQLLNNDDDIIKANKVLKPVKKSKEEPSQLDNSVYRDLGAESEEDVTTTETEDEVELEVNKSIIKVNAITNLEKIRSGYSVAGYIVGFAFGISTIGFLGDLN